jgi:hypothetical protein
MLTVEKSLLAWRTEESFETLLKCTENLLQSVSSGTESIVPSPNTTSKTNSKKRKGSSSNDSTYQPKRSCRTTKANSKYDDYLVASTLGQREQIQSSNFRVQLLYPIIDNFLTEIRFRFNDENMQILRCLDVCNPKSEDFLNEKLLPPILSNYSNHLDDKIFDECKFFKNHMNNCTSLKEMTILDVFAKVSEFPVIFPQLNILFKIVLSLPATTATSERTFSALRRIKDYLRNRTCDERLSSLTLISIEKEIADSIDLDALVDKFASMHRRKLLL